MRRTLVLCVCLTVFCISCGKFRPFTADAKRNANTIDVSFAINRDNGSSKMGMLSTYQLNGLIFRLYKQSGEFAFTEELFGPWNVTSVTDTDVTFAVANMPKIVAGYDLAMFEDNYAGDPTNFTMQRVYYSGTSMNTAAPLDFTTAVPDQVVAINATQIPDCSSATGGFACVADVKFRFCKRTDLAGGACATPDANCGISVKVATDSQCSAVGAFGTDYEDVTTGDFYTSAANYGRYPTNSMNTSTSAVTIAKLFSPWAQDCANVPDSAPVEMCFTHHNGYTAIVPFDLMAGTVSPLCTAAKDATKTVFINISALPGPGMRPITNTPFGALGSDCSAIANFNRALTITQANSF